MVGHLFFKSIFLFLKELLLATLFHILFLTLHKGDLSHILFFSSFFTCLLLSRSFDIFFCFHNEKATQKIEFFSHAEEPRSGLDVVFQPQPQDGALTMVHSHFTCN
jgi:hypothetical protein